LEKKAQLAIDRLHAVIQGVEPITESDRELFSSFVTSEENPNVIAFNSSSPWQPELVSPLLQPKKYNSTSIESLLLLAKNNPDVFNLNNVLLDGVFPVSLLQSVQGNVEKTYNEVKTKEPLERLFWNADFLYSLGMYYTASMVNSMGISEPLQWVPSFPLGSNSVTLSDLSLMFQTFLQGKMFRYFNTAQPNQLLIIKRIEDINGNLLWQSKPKEIAFQDPFFSTPILNTLRGTVTAGTAYLKLNGNVILRSSDVNLDKVLIADKIAIPSFGKTGTTNNYTNGTYIGFLPYPLEKGDNLTPQNAYTIATYVGYDSNQPMIRKWFKAAGGSAIPAWQEVAKEIIISQDFADKLNWQDLAKSGSHLVPFYYGNGLSRVVVPINSGVSVSAQSSDPDDPDSSNDIYASDYTETGRRTFMVYLEGSASDDIFVPKRKVSFYAPFVYVPNDKNLKDGKDMKDDGKAPVDQPVSPAPMAEKSPDSLKSAPTPAPGSADDLPPPPPSIQ
jgi:penicillin-binding protein 1A